MHLARKPAKVGPKPKITKQVYKKLCTALQTLQRKAKAKKDPYQKKVAALERDADGAWSLLARIRLRATQLEQEYAEEGIAWTPVPFFDNRVVCELIEGTKPAGVFAWLDEELQPGYVPPPGWSRSANEHRGPHPCW